MEDHAMSGARWISSVLLAGALAGPAMAGGWSSHSGSWRRTPHCAPVPVRHRAWSQFEIGYDSGWRQGYDAGRRSRGPACAAPRCESGSRQYQRGFQHGYEDGFASGFRAARRAGSFSIRWRSR
jgi:hypothetical protein